MYTLKVPNGTYKADSLIHLLWAVFCHRFHHLITHGKFIDQRVSPMNCFYCDAQVVVDTTGPCEHSENYETEESISCPDCGSIYLVWRGKEEISNDS